MHQGGGRTVEAPEVTPRPGRRPTGRTRTERLVLRSASREAGSGTRSRTRCTWVVHEYVNVNGRSGNRQNHFRGIALAPRPDKPPVPPSSLSPFPNRAGQTPSGSVPSSRPVCDRTPAQGKREFRPRPEGSERLTPTGRTPPGDSHGVDGRDQARQTLAFAVSGAIHLRGGFHASVLQKPRRRGSSALQVLERWAFLGGGASFAAKWRFAA
jgi:hypothetical protein